MDHPEKKPAGRRAAVGTAAARAAALTQAAGGWPEAPSSLSKAEAACWNSIMIARLPQQWARVDLMHAGNLARCLAAIDSNEAALAREGDMIGRGADKRVNPRHALVETLNRRAIALTRVLQLHAVATIGEKSEGAGAAKQAAGSAASALDLDPAKGKFNSDDLLARPRRLQ